MNLEIFCTACRREILNPSDVQYIDGRPYHPICAPREKTHRAVANDWKPPGQPTTTKKSTKRGKWVCPVCGETNNSARTTCRGKGKGREPCNGKRPY